MAIQEFNNNPALTGQVQLIENVVYGAAGGEAQHMCLLTPWAQRYMLTQMTPRPLIVFVQGSSWQLPVMGKEIPQLVQFVHRGYVVATVQHRNFLDGHPFPAFLTDVKAAIRYLRAHAEEYAIDPQRVSIWGTSSGANAAMLVGLTGDDPQYKTAANQDQSDAVNAVVSCFGPTDVAATFEHARGVVGTDVLETALFGSDREKWADLKREMSPLYRIEEGKSYPPFLLMHGDRDQIVPYQQMEQMYDALAAHHVKVDGVRVHGADHERDFWSQAIFDHAAKFLEPIDHPVAE
jgi:acetyl esterase/lipase